MYTGFNIRFLLAKLYNAMLQFSYVPIRMKVGTIITLFKGGNKVRTDPNSYRAITLSSVFLRVYENILLNRIDTQGIIKVDKMQGGFQKNLGCIMTSFSLKECILYGKEQHSRVFVCFLDARQAFDRVWHDGLFFKLNNLGINSSIYKAFVSLYSDMFSRVKFKTMFSEWFPVHQGTSEGGVSSPMLYLVFIDGLLKQLQTSKLGLCIYDFNYASPTVADDMCLVAFSKHALDQMLIICNEYSRRWRYE